MPSSPSGSKRIAIFGLLILLATGTAAQVVGDGWVVIADEHFRHEEWQVTTVDTTVGSNAFALTRPGRGHPDAYRFMHHAVGPVFSVVSVNHVFLGATYDPSTEGAVAGIDYGEDQILLPTGEEVPVQVQPLGVILIEQDGRSFYSAPFPPVSSTEWTVVRSRCLQQNGFSNPDGQQPQQPDFSAAGGPMRFGFQRLSVNSGSSSVSDGFSVAHGLDNFRVVVYQAPNPGCGGGPPDLRIEKTDNDHDVSVDSRIPYELTVENLGGQIAVAPRIDEVVPVSTVFVPGDPRSDPRWSCSEGVTENRVCELELPDLAPGESVTVGFVVEVEAEPPEIPEAWIVFNEARVNHETYHLKGLIGEAINLFVDFCRCSSLPCDDPDFRREVDMLGDDDCDDCPPSSLARRGNLTSLEPSQGFVLQSADEPLLYRLRDRVLELSAGGRRAVALFYEHVGDMWGAAQFVPGYFGETRRALLTWEPVFRALVEGRGDEVSLTQDHVDGFREFFDLLRPVASPTLAAAIDEEIPKLGLDDWVGMSANQVLSELGNLVGGDEDPYPDGEWLTSPQVPDFRFKVRITNQSGQEIPGVGEPACIAETLCVSGAVAGRSEVFLRVVGPKPNGFLWPTLVKFSTAEVDIWAEQLSSGDRQQYVLAGASPGNDVLPGLFDRDGFLPTAASSVAFGPRDGHVPPPAGPWMTTSAVPGFRFKVRITTGTGEQPEVRAESDCIEETLCVSGAIPGRSEVYVRVVGPKPNGYLWPTLVKFSTSQVEVWIEQLSTGEVNQYVMDGAAPGSQDLDGLFDRLGFLP